MQRKHVTIGSLLRRHYLWAPLIALVVALIFGAVAYYQAQNARLLDVYGADAVATVIDRQIHNRRTTEGRQQRSYELQVEFSADGRTIRDRKGVSASRYHDSPVGSEIMLRYVVHDPAINEIEPGDTRFLSLLLGGVAGGFALVSAGIGWLVWRRMASLLRAARHGEVREAQVTAHVPSNTTINRQRLEHALWVDAAGQEGRSTRMRTQKLPAVNSVIAIYIDPRNGRGWWEQDL